MHPHWRRLVYLIFLCLSSCGQNPNEPDNNAASYDVRGYVRRLAEDRSYADILHEAIPNYMSSMTMRLKPAEPSDLSDVSEGDQITFRLVVTPERSWIDTVAKTGERDPSLILEPTPTLSHQMAPGSPLPPFQLVDQDGVSVSDADFSSIPVVVTFLFTRCPLPDYCPLLAKRFQEAQDLLTERHSDKDWVLLAITIDPEFDTPEILKEYGARYNQDRQRWRFLTGDPKTIVELQNAFGLYVAEEGDSLSHNLRTGVFGAEGTLQAAFAGNQWTATELVDAIAATWNSEP